MVGGRVGRQETMSYMIELARKGDGRSPPVVHVLLQVAISSQASIGVSANPFLTHYLPQGRCSPAPIVVQTATVSPMVSGATTAAPHAHWIFSGFSFHSYALPEALLSLNSLTLTASLLVPSH